MPTWIRGCIPHCSSVRHLALAALACLLPGGAIAHGGFDQRVEVANRAVAAAPTDPEPLLARAELHRRHHDFAAALQGIEDARRLSPHLDRIHYFRGLVYLDTGRYHEAEADLRRFVDRSPEHAAGHEAYARVLLELGRPLAAARNYDRVIALQPVPIPDHYIQRARAFAAAGSAYLEQAIQGLDQGLSVLGPVITLERVAIDLELQRGETPAALARIERITNRSPRRETWLAQRGDILAQAGRPADARKSFALALAQLEQLPGARRRTPAMARLEAHIHASLARLGNLPTGATP